MSLIPEPRPRVSPTAIDVIEQPLYLEESPRADHHRRLLRCLLYFTPASARQIPELKASWLAERGAST